MLALLALRHLIALLFLLALSYLLALPAFAISAKTATPSLNISASHVYTDIPATLLAPPHLLFLQLLLALLALPRLLALPYNLHVCPPNPDIYACPTLP